MIDFDQKDGSGEKFTGTWDGDGILFPDGNKWLRKELSTIPQARSIQANVGVELKGVRWS